MKINTGIKIACMTLAVSLSGCTMSDMNNLVANGSAVTTNKHLNPISPDKVKIYDKTPKLYTSVGRISAENYTMVGLEHSQASIYNELKKQAASIGANGVIDVVGGLATTTAKAIKVN